ncbi:regulation of nuclear pre-mRNA domain-containing protein 1B isoform X7 [Macaca fascicularis]|uniref:regulation of nuclear pre-mRNA domain-containing protein 1B isoform X7 n=1 Tax=Macaca fascicularis TaxID=9541 RepID=UPI003D158819
MSSFSESALEKKLSELSNSQQSVQTLSLWLIHHRKHAGPIVSVWHRELRKATEEKKSLKRTFQQIQEEEDDDYPGSYSPQDPSAGPLLTEELIKALQDLENAASGDATVRQKIASLPQEVQDVSLLEKITGIQTEACASNPGPQGTEIPYSELARPLTAAQRHRGLSPPALCWGPVFN